LDFEPLGTAGVFAQLRWFRRRGFPLFLVVFIIASQILFFLRDFRAIFRGLKS
jgi:hypothetical protein